MAFPLLLSRYKSLEGGAAAPFSPSDIAGLQFWLKADTGVYQDAAGTTPAAADGDVVGLWQDQSGNGYHLAQTDNTKRPLLKLGDSGFNGHAAIRFDNSNDLLVNATADWLSSDSTGTIILVCQLTAIAVNDTLFATADEGAVTRYIKILPYYSVTYPSNLIFVQRNADTEDAVVGSTTLYTITTYLFVIRSDNSDYFLRVNGNDETITVASGANSGDWFDSATARDNFALGAWKTSSETNFGGLQVSEVIVYGSNLTGTNLSNVESYIQSRYGMTFTSTVIGYLGDSITSQTAVVGYPTVLNFTYNDGNVITKNHAVTGHSIMTNMDAQTVAAATDAANTIIIQLGTNDDNGGNMAALQAEAEENIAELKLSNASATIYWLNVLPRWTDSGGGTPVDKSNIRTAIAAACTAQGITCWDTFTDPWLTAAQTSDGLHPTAAGHAAIAARVKALLP